MQRYTRNFFTHVLSFLAISAFVVGAPLIVLAQSPATPQIQIENHLKVNNLRELITNTVPNFLLSLVGAVAVAFFLINAVKYLLGAGNTESTGEAKLGMLAGIIGLVVALTALLVMSTVQGLLGL